MILLCKSGGDGSEGKKKILPASAPYTVKAAASTAQQQPSNQ